MTACDHALQVPVHVHLSSSDARNLRRSVRLIKINYRTPSSDSFQKISKPTRPLPTHNILKSKREDKHCEGHNNQRVKWAAPAADHDDKPRSILKREHEDEAFEEHDTKRVKWAPTADVYNDKPQSILKCKREDEPLDEHNNKGGKWAPTADVHNNKPQSILKRKREAEPLEQHNGKHVKWAASVPDNDDKPLSRQYESMRWTKRKKRTLTNDEIHAKLNGSGRRSQWLRSIREEIEHAIEELEESSQDETSSDLDTQSGTNEFPQDATSGEEWSEADAESLAILEEIFGEGDDEATGEVEPSKSTAAASELEGVAATAARQHKYPKTRRSKK